jgi:hypothetical protein
MVLQASGEIRMSQIKNEFSASYPLGMSQMYTNCNTAPGASGIVSGNPIRITNFYGKSAVPGGNVVWNTRVAGGTNYLNMAKGICSTTDGGFIVNGTYSGGSNITVYNADGSAFRTTPNASLSCGLCVKYDTSGNAKFTTRVDTQYESRAVCSITDGGYVTTGLFNTNSTIVAYGSNDASSNVKSCLGWGGGAYVVKFNSNGTYQWTAQIAASNCTCYTTCAAGTTDGGSVLGGFFTNPGVVRPMHANGTYPGIQLSGGSNYEPFLIKYDHLGSVVWGARNVSSTYDSYERICNTNDNGCLCVGATKSPIYKMYHANGSSYSNLSLTSSGNLLAIKYNGAGSIEWYSRGSLSSNTAMGYCCCELNDSNLIVGGYYGGSNFTIYSSSGTAFSTVLPLGGMTDGVLIKYNSTGTVQWVTHISTMSNETYPRSVVGTNDNGFVVCGYYSGCNLVAYNSDGTAYSTQLPAAAGYYDAYIVKYDGSGYVKWLTRALSSAGDVGTAVTKLTDGDLVMCGYWGDGGYAIPFTSYNANGTAYSNTLSAGGSNSWFIVKYTNSN